MAAIALTLLANSYYDSSNTKETRQEIEHKLSAYRAAPVQTVEAVIGALSNLELLTNSAQVLCLSILEQAITAAFQSLPDEARSLVYESLLKLSLPVAGGPVVSTAVQSVASKVLAKVVALSYAITFQPFMGELLGQLRAGSNVPQCLRLLFECLVGWLGDGGRGGVSAPNRGDPFQASVRLARNAIVANMASVLELLMSLLGARPAPDAGPAAAAALARFDSEVTQQVLSILEHLAKVLPDPAALLLSDDLLRMLSYFSAAVVNPGAAPSDVNNGTAALEVLSVLVQRGITRAAGGGAGGEAVAGMRSQLMQLCITLLAVACGTDPAAGTPDVATATARLADMEIDCAWALHGFTAAACTHLLPAVEGDPSFPALRFCHLLFTFTLAQPDTDGFIRLLRLWGDLAERVASPPPAGSPLSPAAGAAEAAAARRESYTSAFRSLAGQLLGKVLYSSNAPGLESLSDDAEAEDEEERAAEGVLVGVRFGGEAGMMGGAGIGAASSPSSTGAVSSSSATSAVGVGGGHGRMMSGAGDDGEDGSGGFMRGPPSVHRMSVRTRLPSSAFTARPLQVNVFAASGTGMGPAAGAGGSGRFDSEDEDDEMQQAAALSVGTALADSRDSAGDDEGEGGGADGFGSPVGGGGGGMGGGGVAGSGAAAAEDAGPRMSERGRYIQAALLLLSKLAALPAVAEEVLGSAGTSLQAACTALAAALAAAAAASSVPASAFSGGRPSPFAPPAGHAGGRAGGSGGSPETELRRHACDVAVLFTLLADVGPAIVHASASSQHAILTMAGQMLALALQQGWNMRGAGPLTRVIAAALITARAFLPVLNAYARQALALDGGAGAAGAAEGGAAPLGIEAVVSLLNEAVAPALQLLDCTLSPPPAGVADAAIALLVQLSQQPQLRVIARTPAVPSLQGMLLGDGGAGWRRLLNGLPSSHQAHALLAALRVILAAAPAQQGAAAGRAGGLASPPGAAAGAAAVGAGANPMAAALLAADLPPEARSEGAAALLQPLTAVLTQAVAPPAAGSAGVAAPGGEGFVALLTDAAALGPRVSRAVGLLCAALSGAGEAGSGPALQGVLGNALAAILTGSCAAVCQLVDAAASPLSAGALAASPSGRYGGGTPFRGGGAGFGVGVTPGVTATLERSRSFGAASPYAVAPLLAAAELLRLLAASVGALRRSLPDQYLMQVLAVLGPQLGRLHELSGDAGAGSISGGGGVAGVGGGGGRGLSGKASAGLLPSILYLLRLLRACAAQGPPTPGGPAAAAQGSAAGELRCALMSAACGTVRALAQPAGFRFSEEIAPAAMTLVRAVLRSQWRSLVGPPAVDPATGQRTRAFASPDAAEQVAACSGLFGAWLSNASASPELFRFALLNALALQREVGLWQVPRFREASLPELEVTLLDALVRGERPTLAEEVSRALVGMASAHREDFAARVLPAWMARCLGAENIPAVAGRLDPAVGAALTSAAAGEGDYGDALLCLVSTVRSWQLITQEALAVAGGSTVPLYS